MPDSPAGNNRSIDRNTAIGYVDIDNFKHINDTHGHQFGDEVIAKVNEIGIICVPDRAEFTREYGQGDEFVVILPDTDKDEAESVLEQFRETVRDDQPNGTEVTVSIGIAEAQSEPPNFDEVKGQAEEAMRRAKKWGGNQVQIYGEFESLKQVDVTFDLQASPGRPDDLMIIEVWRDGTESDIRAEEVRNETTGAKYTSETANTTTSVSYSHEEIRAVVSSIQSVGRRGVNFTVHIRESQYMEHLAE